MSEVKDSVEYDVVETAMGFIIVADPYDRNSVFLLALKRKGRSGWHFPNCLLKENSEPVDTLLEMVNKETGLTRTDKVTSIGKYRTTFKKSNKLYKVAVYQFVYNFPVYIELTNKNEDIKFCTLEEVQELPIVNQSMKYILTDYLKKLGVLSDEVEESKEAV